MALDHELKKKVPKLSSDSYFHSLQNNVICMITFETAIMIISVSSHCIKVEEGYCGKECVEFQLIFHPKT